MDIQAADFWVRQVATKNHRIHSYKTDYLGSLVCLDHTEPQAFPHGIPQTFEKIQI